MIFSPLLLSNYYFNIDPSIGVAGLAYGKYIVNLTASECLYNSTLHGFLELLQL